MRKTIAVAGIAGALMFGGVGMAFADDPADSSDQTVVVNQSNTSTSGSSDCAPASVLVWFPWLQVPVCS